MVTEQSKTSSTHEKDAYPNINPTTRYSNKQAAALLGVKPSTLSTWRNRSASYGPVFSQTGARGKVLYLGSDLRLWLARRDDAAEQRRKRFAKKDAADRQALLDRAARRKELESSQ